MTLIEEAVAIAKEHMAARQRSTGNSYYSGRMLAKQLGVTLRRTEYGHEKAIALAIIAAAWLALPRVSSRDERAAMGRFRGCP